MRWTDLVLLSAQNLWRRKLRTILTMVGVMIGTASIVVMVSMAIGINQGNIESLAQTGELTRVELNSMTYYTYSGGEVPTITLDDDTTVEAQKLDDTMVRKIAALDHVEAVTPLMDVWVFTLRTGKLESYNNPQAVLPGSEEVLGMEFAEGGGFSDDMGETVEVILGSDTLSSFHKKNSQVYTDEAPDLDWLNEKYSLIYRDYNDMENDEPKEYEFKARVVGVLEETGGEADWNIYCNLNNIKTLIQKNKSLFKKDSELKVTEYPRGYVKVDDFNYALDVQEEIQKLGISAWSYAQMIENMQQQSRSMQLMLGGIGAIAMLVAAISIANTMLMSIYERTREIGVMKVLGCRLGTIGAMFLCEAAMIGLGGGIVGLLLSYGIGGVVNLVMDAYGGYSSFRSVIPLWLAALGLSFATLVGMLSGLYPSQRAMRLSALAAIRNE